VVCRLGTPKNQRARAIGLFEGRRQITLPLGQTRIMDVRSEMSEQHLFSFPKKGQGYMNNAFDMEYTVLGVLWMRLGLMLFLTSNLLSRQKLQE
jgi:hypothetical protein